MENWQLAMFIREVGNQADTFDIAGKDFNTAYGSLGSSNPDADEQWTRLFMALQAMVGAAAMISKLLWPNSSMLDFKGDPLDEEGLRMREIRIARGGALRNALDVKAIPILQSRKVRNAFEHFDEELDAFFDSPSRFWTLDHNIGPIDQAVVVSEDGDVVSKTLRLFDPESGNAHVAGKNVNVQDLANAVSALNHKSRVGWQTLRSNSIASAD